MSKKTKFCCNNTIATTTTTTTTTLSSSSGDRHKLPLPVKMTTAMIMSLTQIHLSEFDTTGSDVFFFFGLLQLLLLLLQFC
jgi:hypothetical protein